MELRGPKVDKSDQKATNHLIQSLLKLSSDKKNTEAASSSKRSLSRKRRIKIDENQPKITKWTSKPKHPKVEQKFKPLDIKKEKACSSKNSNISCLDERLEKENQKTKKNRKRDPMFDVKKGEACSSKNSNISCLEKGLEKESRKTEKGRTRDPMFEKYGIVVPSYEKIVADHKKFDEHKQSVKQLDVFDDAILEKTLVADCLQKEEFKEELFDCEHLSKENLSDYFQKYSKTLKRIIKGKKFSERHYVFHNTKVSEVSGRDLKYSPALMVFTYEQKEHLLGLMESEFDPEDKLTSYFFKVLLPELCLCVFKDEHNMSEKNAIEYLERRPFDN